MAYERMEPWELEEALQQRKSARQIALNEAIRGNGICGALFALESIAEPFFLGLDYDATLPDEDDVRPF